MLVLARQKKTCFLPQFHRSFFIVILDNPFHNYDYMIDNILSLSTDNGHWNLAMQTLKLHAVVPWSTTTAAIYTFTCKSLTEKLVYVIN